MARTLRCRSRIRHRRGRPPAAFRCALAVRRTRPAAHPARIPARDAGIAGARSQSPAARLSVTSTRRSLLRHARRAAAIAACAVKQYFLRPAVQGERQTVRSPSRECRMAPRAGLPSRTAAYRSRHHAPALAQRATGRTAEISMAGPAAPALIWRSADNPAPPGRPAQPADAGRARTIDNAGAAAESSASAQSTIQAETAAQATPAAGPDIDQIAEQVTRLLARRIEIERERRGARGWR